MRIWQGILLTILLAAVPLLAACGPTEAEKQQTEYYRQALEAYQKQQSEYNESCRAAMEQYQAELEKSYKAAADNLTSYYQQQVEQMQKQIEQLEQQAK